MANAGNRGFGFPEQQGGSSRISPTTGTGTRTEESSPGGVVGTLKEKAQDVASTLGSTAESAWEGTQQAASAVAGTAEEAWDSVISCMSRYPLATFCTGIGLGFLLARALGNTSMTRTMRSWLPYSWSHGSPFGWNLGQQHQPSYQASHQPSYGGGNYGS